MSQHPIQTLLQQIGMSQAQLARQLGISAGTLSSLITSGHWPRRAAARLRADLPAALTAAGARADAARAAVAALSAPAPSISPTPQSTQPQEDDDMLMQHTPLSPAAARHFGAPRTLFSPELSGRDDVFQCPDTRYARAALLDCAVHHGFIALVGESGSGKTTLVRELEQRLIDEGRDILIVEPYTLGMEASDTRGRTLKVAHLAESLIAALDPSARIKASPQARFAQLHALLKSSRRAGRRHLLIIDEAHCLPTATLKHLKRFLDQLRDGMTRLLGIALIAQPELRNLLHSQNPEVREVVQRCEIIDLPPLDAHLGEYLSHKFTRAGLQVGDVLASDAVEALRTRLVRTQRGTATGLSCCYPLAVQNLLARAMNAAAAAGWPKVDAQVIAAC